MLAGGIVGTTASFLETIEYQQLLKNAHASLACNLNSVFSCGNVLNAWQSKVFGFPNSMMCMLFFTLMASAGLIGLTGSTLAPRLRLLLHSIALFFLGFGTWFMWQSTFRIVSLCILCLFCFSGLLAINWTWLRLNIDILPLPASWRRRMHKVVQQGADTFIWLTFAIVIAFIMLWRFA